MTCRLVAFQSRGQVFYAIERIIALASAVVELRLTAISWGTLSDDNLYRIQRVSLGIFPPEDQKIVTELRNSRVLLLRPESRGNQVVEFAREEILTYWKRLQSWLKEDRDFLSWLPELTSNLARWQRAKSGTANVESSLPGRDELLLKGSGLTTAMEWIDKKRSLMFPIELWYIGLSQRKNGTGSIKDRKQSPRYAKIPPNDSQNVAQALTILRGKQAEPKEMLALARKLKSELRFSYARRLLIRARNHEGIARDRRLRRTSD